MLEKVKLALRYRNSLFDDEIIMLIEACKQNLILSGINEEKFIDIDSSILNAIICYCKWQLNFQGKGEEWGKVYKDVKTALVLDTNYNVH